MKIKINNVEIFPMAYKVVADSTLICRETNITVETKENYKVGDKFEVFNPDGSLFMKGEVEAVNEYKEGFSVLLGRNKISEITYAKAKKRKQFNRGLGLNAIFSSILSEFGIKVLGDVNIPKKEDIVLVEGTKIIDFCIDLAKSLGVVIYSDANDNLVLEGQNTNKGIILEEKSNMIEYTYADDTKNLYNKILIKSQDQLQPNIDTSSANEYSVGTGKNEEVIRYPIYLQQNECKEIGDRFYKIYKKNAKRLIAEVAMTLSLEVGDVCKIKTKEKEYDMVLRRIEKTFVADNATTSKMTCYFEDKI